MSSLENDIIDLNIFPVIQIINVNVSQEQV